MSSRYEVSRSYEEAHELAAYERLLQPDYEPSARFYETYCCPTHSHPPKVEVDGAQTSFDHVVTAGLLFDDDHVAVLYASEVNNPHYLFLTYPHAKGRPYGDDNIVTHQVTELHYGLEPIIGREKMFLALEGVSGYNGKPFQLKLTSHENTWRYHGSRTQYPLEQIEIPLDVTDEVEEIYADIRQWKGDRSLFIGNPFTPIDMPRKKLSGARCLDI